MPKLSCVVHPGGAGWGVAGLIVQIMMGISVIKV